MKSGSSLYVPLSPAFPSYTGFGPKVPVKAVTPEGRPCIHRFYDSSPISPSGQFLVVTELPYENCAPMAGDEAYVLVIDLASSEVVFRHPTTAWGTQVGAHAQWGSTDNELFFNVADGDFRPFGLKIDIWTGEKLTLQHPIYMVSPDGRLAISPSLDKLSLVQFGYGMTVPDAETKRNVGAPADDGIFLVDAKNGQAKLLLSLHDIYIRLKPRFGDLDLDSGALYGFHTKWSPDQTKIMFIVRWVPHHQVGRKTKNFLVCISSDGKSIWMPIDSERWHGGHHPNWCSDSSTIVMNLRDNSTVKPLRLIADYAGKIGRRLGMRTPRFANLLRFYMFQYDGSHFQPVPNHTGSGHPTLSPSGRWILTDSYTNESVAFGDGTVPIRLVPIDGSEEDCLIRISCMPKHSGRNAEWRVDPHPAWDRQGRCIAFNGYADGIRKVYIADLSGVSL